MLFVAAVLALGASTAHAALPAPSEVQASLASASAYFRAQPVNAPSAASNDCGWEHGALYSGHTEHMKIAPAAEKPALTAWALRWADAHNWTCNSLWTDPNNIACGMGYAALYDAAPADYKLALAVTLDRGVTGWGPYSWWWVDTLFMGLPTTILYGNRTGDARITEAGLQQYRYTTLGGPNATSQPGLWDPASNLYWRDHTYIAQRNSDGTKVFWGRGNGWAAGALALAHRALPPSDTANREEMAARLQSMLTALKPLQQADGMWRANLLFPTMPGVSNPESTSSGFFTFALAYALNAGIVDAATFEPVLERAWAALTTISLQPSGLVGWCQPVGGGPAPANLTDTSQFCVGAFLLAGSEVFRRASM